ncbi:MAG: hypothetical protein RIE73_23905 [Coleofasciculus sp. C1-SOL-03]
MSDYLVLDASTLLADLKVNRVDDIKCKLSRSRAESRWHGG